MRFSEALQVDPLHGRLAFDADGHVEQTSEFAYDEVDRNVFGIEDEEDSVSYADMAAALALVLNWCCSSPNLTHVGARAAALLCLLDPTNSPHGRDSLANIAREANLTRAAISKWIVQFREEADISLTVGKLNSTRKTFRDAQLVAYANGRGAGDVRKAKRLAALAHTDVVSSAR
jgi:hypothetical protein